MLHPCVGVPVADLDTDNDGVAEGKSVHILHVEAAAYIFDRLLHTENLAAVLQEDTPRLQSQLQPSLGIRLDP